MRLTLPRLSVVAVLATGGCAAIIGLPDYSDSTSGTGGGGHGGGATSTGGHDAGPKGTTSTGGHATSSTASTGSGGSGGSGGGGGSAPSCDAGAPCYLGLDGTEGVAPCSGGTWSCEGGAPVCVGDVRPTLQACSGEAASAACEGIAGCTGQSRWASGGLPANLAAVAAGLDGTVAAVGNSTGTPGFFLLTLDAHGRACGTQPLIFNGNGQLGATGVALIGAKLTPDGRPEQLQCGQTANGRAASTVVVGNANGPIDFGPSGVQTGPLMPDGSPGGTNGFVAVVGPTDQIVWGRLFGSVTGDSTNAVATGPNGEIYLTGSFGGALSVPPCTGTLDGGGLAPGAGPYVARVEKDGSCGWVRVFSGNGAGTSIAVDGNGKVVVGGIANGSIDFDGTMLGPGANAFIARLQPDGTLDAPPLGAACSGGDPPVVAATSTGISFLMCDAPSGACIDDAGAPSGVNLSRIGASFTGTGVVNTCIDGPAAIQAKSLAMDGDDNLVVVVSTGGPIDSAAFHATIPVGGVVAFKMSPPGYKDYVWASVFGAGVSFPSGMRAAVDGMGNTVLVVNPQSPVVTPPSPVVLPAGGAVVELSP